MSDAIVRVCSKDDVPENTVKSFEVGNAVIAVYNIGGMIYATDNECTHGAASLADGILDGDVIECSLHFGAFHIPTGDVVAPPCAIPLRTYKVVMQGEDICIDLDKSAGDPD
jgi:nitrite reductase/ring-hydroxylating ferredoxin subunit